MDKFKIPPATGLSPIIYSNLDTYFDKTALYTNTHFYSKDSIGFYEEPVPVRVDSGYIYGRDDNGLFKLASIEGKSLVDKKLDKEYKTGVDDPLVLQDYWNRLAPFAVENSAGIIKLFKDVAEEEIVIVEEKLTFWDKTKEWGIAVSDFAFSALNYISGVGGYFSSSNIQVQTVSTCGELETYLMTSPGTCINSSFYINSTTEDQNHQAQQNFYTQLQNSSTGVGSDPTPVEFDIDTTDSADSTDRTDNIDNTDTSDKTDTPTKQTHLVTRVIDGDTVELQNGERVRYIGINTPELPNGCFAKEATEYNEQLVLNKTVTLEQGPDDRDSYGRLLRYVYINNIFVNQNLVETGHAYAFDFGFTHEFTDNFEEIEEEAKEDRRGLWGDVCHPVGGEVL
ncbi:MAG: thermonuclease family protein, partial [Candidatus Spechtbacterales bacterium]